MKRTMTSNLLPGMVLAENVYTYNNDQLILPKGAVLDDKSIAKLEFYSTVNVLVEDEIDLSNIVKIYLERAGYNVICFTKGSEAIDYIGNKVDLWILDIMLGDDINGYDVIKQIREQDKEVPVIFTSARDQDLDKIHYQIENMQGDEYLG